MILTVVMDRMAAVLRRCLPLRAAGAAVCTAAMACVAGCGDAPLTDDGGMSSGVVRPSVREYRAEFRIVLEGEMPARVRVRPRRERMIRAVRRRII